MAITNGPLGHGVVIHLVICLLFGVVGLSNNAIILRYFVKKEKLDQLSILYSVMSIISTILSSLHILQFIFFNIPGIYYIYTIDPYCQSNAALFFAAVIKLLYMTAVRSSLFIITVLVFLTTSKVKWKIFKVQTRMMKYIITICPGVVFLVIGINCFVELKCTTPFFLPWLGITDAMTTIYFWLLIVLPTILCLACLVALFRVVLGGEADNLPSLETPKPEPEPETAKDVKAESGAGITKTGSLKIPKKLEMVKQKVHSSKETIATKLSEGKAKVGNKFKNREVTKRTIITVMILGGITVIAMTPSVVMTLKTIYSTKNLLVYNNHNAATFNIAYIFSTLVPSLTFVIIIPIIMMIRVTGINRYIHKKMGNITTKADQ